MNFFDYIRGLAAHLPPSEPQRGGHPGPFGGPGYAPPSPPEPPRDHDVCYLLGRCADGAERDGGRLRHAVRGYRALCRATHGRQSAGWSAHQANAYVTCPRCLKKLSAEQRKLIKPCP